MVGLILARADIRRDVEIGRDLHLGLSQFEATVPEADRALLQAAWTAERRVCHEHGGDISECDHKTWYPHREVCWPAAALAAAQAAYDALHEDQPYHDGTFQSWSAKRGGKFKYHYRDGVTITVHREDLTPGEDFLAKRG